MLDLRKNSISQKQISDEQINYKTFQDNRPKHKYMIDLKAIENRDVKGRKIPLKTDKSYQDDQQEQIELKKKVILTQIYKENALNYTRSIQETQKQTEQQTQQVSPMKNRQYKNNTDQDRSRNIQSQNYSFTKIDGDYLNNNLLNNKASRQNNTNFVKKLGVKQIAMKFEQVQDQKDYFNTNQSGFSKNKAKINYVNSLKRKRELLNKEKEKQNWPDFYSIINQP
ncbi:UNKNOWN [Stylonychia lemnae]|uniref:Uncharacterized protein n=1 Tax=Stylonychia lemnae TaxID=5949 RepID=A0A078AK28_STYLE|nr:UNKNOWN [Stylonychia lemnae]|eukprot:CDW82740.1 UNKNOWN [Stylonychia lemnae]